MTATVRADRIDHIAALRTALATTGRGVYTYSEIAAIPEAQRPDDYIVFDVSRVTGGAQMFDGTDGTSLWRAGTRAVSNDDYNTDVLLDDCRTALEGQTLTVGGAATGPICFETEDPVAPDDGRYSGLIDWTYDHT